MIEGDPHFINTKYFSAAANHFRKHGRYTLAPKYSKDWYEYWEEEERRWKYGYKVGGVKITGKHYFYLNYTKLARTDVDSKGKITAVKEPDFPAFWKIDYDWWWYKEVAWRGCKLEVLPRLHLTNSPLTLEGGRHIVCGKTRRAGFSYKEGAEGVYNFHMHPGSKNIYLASKEDYLIDDGILNKVEYNLNFLNQHTDGWLLKHRMKHSTTMHQMASYKLAGGQDLHGTLSEIIGVTVTDPSKARGKDALKMTFEEGGSFPNLKKALRVALSSLKEGAIYTGQASVFGTGGEEDDSGLEGLQEIMENPRAWNMLVFHNVFDHGLEETECGVFVPTYMANPSFMNDDGGINVKEALDYEMEQRRIIKTTGDTRDYDAHIAEHPINLSEMFARKGDPTLPRGEALAQLNRIRRSKELQATITYGDLVYGTKGLEFMMKPKEEARPIDYYPHKNSEDLTSCITVFERPQKTTELVNNVPQVRVPKGAYVVVVDPYYKDDADSRVSLGAAYVVKLKNGPLGGLTDINVAWYVGRYDKTRGFHELLFKLAEWYNATIQSEIAGGGQGIHDYAREVKKLHMLEFEPVHSGASEIEKISKNRNYFMNISTEDKKLGLTYYADWLKTVVGLDADGNPILNIHYEYDIGLLIEISKWNSKGNFDRVSTQIVKQFQLIEVRERTKNGIKKKNREGNKNRIIGVRPLFADSNTSGSFGSGLVDMRNEMM